jgi:hypothetical protein
VSPLNLDDNEEDAVAAQVGPSPSDVIREITLESCLFQLKQKEIEIMELRRKLENSKKLADVYKAKAKNSAVHTSQVPQQIDVQLELDEAIVKAVTELIASDQRFRSYGNAHKGRLIAKALFHSRELGSISLPFIIANAKKWLRKHVFTPWKMLKVMDLAGGSCNYKGVEVL